MTKTQIFGILNITPDSFSDPMINFNNEQAIINAKKMIAEGVFAIDIGAESTRPNATPIHFQEEISRLEPILPKVIKLGAKVSLDSYHFETAEWGVKQGISIINDVSGGKDERMIELACKNNLQFCFMHSLTVPTNPKIVIEGEVLSELLSWGEERIKTFTKLGMKKENLIFDVGIGFGKTAEQSLTLLQNIEVFKSLGVKLFVGHSRKLFLKHAFKINEVSEISEPSIRERDLMTAVFSALLWNKVDFLRLHNTQITSLFKS
jgi:dihydropteroate synthase